MGKTIFKPGKAAEKKIAERKERGVTNVKAFIFISWLLETCSLACLLAHKQIQTLLLKIMSFFFFFFFTWCECGSGSMLLICCFKWNGHIIINCCTQYSPFLRSFFLSIHCNNEWGERMCYTENAQRERERANEEEQTTFLSPFRVFY